MHLTPRDSSGRTPHFAWADEEVCAAEAGETHLALVARRWWEKLNIQRRAAYRQQVTQDVDARRCQLPCDVWE